MQGAQKRITVGAIHESPLRVRRHNEVAAQRGTWPFCETTKMSKKFLLTTPF